MRINKRFFAFSLTLLLGLPSLSRGAETKARVVHWLVAHDRGHNAFTELNEKFAKDLERKSGGSLKIEFVRSEASDSEVDETAYRQVLEGQADMSQLPATAVGVHVLDMPFLFRSYKHAEAVWTGPVNDKLVAQIEKGSGGKVHGFAFTYSGGYRLLAGRVAVKRLSDLKGARIRDSRSYLSPFLASLGASRVKLGAPSKDRPIDDVISGKLDLEETEINRLSIVERAHPGVVKQLGNLSLTRHRMYTTAIVAGEKFYRSLTDSQRALLTEEMEKLAAAERKLSVDLEAKNMKFLAERGATLVDFADADRAAFAEAGAAFRKTIPELDAQASEILAVKEPVHLADR